jgi:hypothetical protein
MSGRIAVKRGRIRSLLLVLLILGVIVGLVGFLRSPRVGAVLQALEAPRLPPRQEFAGRVWLAPGQNWDTGIRQRFHHVSQGTRTLPIPLSWFMALEAPASSLATVPFEKPGLFSADDYLLRFGFIEGERSEHNPLKLPIGLATTPYQNLPGITGRVTALGFTCAACHTGHIAYDGIEYIVEGGPATTDLGQLTAALGAALGQTLLSAKVPFLHGRFDRFAKNVLGPDAYSDANIALLQSELEALVDSIAGIPAGVDVVEGYTRLDALNRIGNQVFAIDTGRFDNYVPIDAPVNYPHIWTAPWFDWVQYDASIMAPLIRNAGEAMGVSAGLNTVAPKAEKRFSSSIDMRELWWIENAIAGSDPDPASDGAGLLAPPWPEAFPAIDRERARRGRAIYEDICTDCHLPVLSSPDIWTTEHFRPVEYYVDGELRETPQRLIRLKLIDLQQVGTDPAQSEILAGRTVDTSGVSEGRADGDRAGMGIDAEICVNAPGFPDSAYNPVNYASRSPGDLVNVRASDGPMLSFGLALGAAVQQTIDAWYDLNYIPEDLQRRFEESRPNCLRPGNGYKARPLNGVWATAPFLHNGSVPTVKDLLSPPDQRPDYVLLGDVGFDPVNLGLVRDRDFRPDNDEVYDDSGYFILDTATPGNYNTGHEFSDEWDESLHWSQQKKGVIGPAFSDSEVMDLIEYLKTL